MLPLPLNIGRKAARRRRSRSAPRQESEGGLEVLKEGLPVKTAGSNFFFHRVNLVEEPVGLGEEVLPLHLANVIAPQLVQGPLVIGVGGPLVPQVGIAGRADVLLQPG